MAYFKDLTRYEYTGNLFLCVGEPLNIGWLERCAAYPKGVVDPDLTLKLLALCKFPINCPFGLHACHFCNESPVRITDSDGEFCLGCGEIRVPTKDKSATYVAPSLIYHYVVAHQYLPPDAFLDALRALSLPSPAVVWILEGIELSHSSPEFMAAFLGLLLKREKPIIPPELREAVVEAANELKVTQPVALEAAEKIVNRLKSLLTRPN